MPQCLKKHPFNRFEKLSVLTSHTLYVFRLRMAVVLAFSFPNYDDDDVTSLNDGGMTVSVVLFIHM